MLTNATFHTLGYIQNLHGGHRSRDRMVVRFTTTYAISSNSAHGEKKQNKQKLRYCWGNLKVTINTHIPLYYKLSMWWYGTKLVLSVIDVVIRH